MAATWSPSRMHRARRGSGRRAGEAKDREGRQIAKAESKAAKKTAPQPAVEVETIEEPVVQAYAEPVPTPKALAAVDPISTSSTGSAPSGWAIQVASTPDQGQAKSLLAKTGKQASSILADAAAYTVPFDKGGVTYYRVRFGGFASKSAAWDACGALKKKKIACYAVLQ